MHTIKLPGDLLAQIFALPEARRAEALELINLAVRAACLAALGVSAGEPKKE